MKTKSREIRDLLEAESLTNLKVIQSNILNNGYHTEHNEYTIDEAVVDLDNIRDFLIKAIDDGLLDTFSYSIKKTLYKHLNLIKTRIEALNNNQDVSINLLDDIPNLKQFLVTNLNYNILINDYYDFSKEHKKLSALKQKYGSLLVELDRTNHIYEKIKTQAQDVENIHSTCQQLKSQNANLTNDIAEQNLSFNEICDVTNKNYDKLVSEAEEIDKFYSQLKTEKKELAKINSELNTLVKKYDVMCINVNELVNKAMGGRLGKDFGERKKELVSSERNWRIASTVAIILLFLAAGVVLFELVIGTGDSSVLISRLSLLIPASVAVWFTSSNHNRERKLLEDYAFKAIIALTLNPYRDVLKEELPEDDQNIVCNFIVETIQKLYSSPLENISKHNSKENELSMVENVVNLVNKMPK
jgi:hypothetical protein